MLVTLGSIPRAGSTANWVRSTISDSSCVSRLCAPLLPRHGDLEPLLGRDQVIVVVISEVDLHPFDSAGEGVSARPHKRSIGCLGRGSPLRSAPAISGRTATNVHRDRRLAIGQLRSPVVGAKRQPHRGLGLLSSEWISAAVKFRVGAFNARARPPAGTISWRRAHRAKRRWSRRRS
jgi:hypothetical protein